MYLTGKGSGSSADRGRVPRSVAHRARWHAADASWHTPNGEDPPVPRCGHSDGVQSAVVVPAGTQVRLSTKHVSPITTVCLIVVGELAADRFTSRKSTLYL